MVGPIPPARVGGRSPRIVLDASYAIAVVMGDEPVPVSTDVVLAAQLLVPPVWTWEMGNILRVSLRRGRLGRPELPAVLQAVDTLAVRVEPAAELSVGEWLDLADRHGLTTYDAQYLDLALQQRCGLATQDRRLAEAAERLGLPVYG
ncbi:MAG: type II toxin-antitoxin system VapC family toxin [Burkholderiaceae bacterium]|nr:type II toxin-antitoxin system VapC family toxin [Burkholderiaceae bacterium]